MVLMTTTTMMIPSTVSRKMNVDVHSMASTKTTRAAATTAQHARLPKATQRGPGSTRRSSSSSTASTRLLAGLLGDPRRALGLVGEVGQREGERERREQHGDVVEQVLRPQDNVQRGVPARARARACVRAYAPAAKQWT